MMLEGEFRSISIPEVPAGQEIIATIDFYALNPGALYWSTFLIVDSPVLGLRKLLDKAREIGQDGGRKKSYSLGIMPDQVDVGISFFIFAHDDASYDWSWGEYDAWLNGYGSLVTHLDSDYRWISPGAPTEPPADLKVLDYQILGKSQGGSINFDPPALDNEGHYQKYTVVGLTAVVNPGFRFVKWRGEVDNQLSTSLTNTVTMSENRLVKAEFALAEVGQFYPLEIDLTPTAAGYVTTDPPPNDIENYFIDGTIGKFPAGTRVLVTAHPGPGYNFLKWSDEIQGGVSYSNPEYVAGAMDEHRAVKAHFVESGAPAECSIDSDCPPGYVCRNGVCEPEGGGPPPPPPPPAEQENPWLIPLLIGGLALLLIPGERKR